MGEEISLSLEIPNLLMIHQIFFFARGGGSRKAAKSIFETTDEKILEMRS